MAVTWTLEPFPARAGGLEITSSGRLLGPGEAAAWSRLRIPKRQADWLGARLVFKGLLQSLDEPAKTGRASRLEILNEPGGAPYLLMNGRRAGGTISLSHCRGAALCAWSPEQILLGVDLEWVEARPAEFAADFFTTREVCQIAEMDETSRPLAETLAWSGKEAVLKAFRTGLRVDTRSVEVFLPSDLTGPNGWNTININSKMDGADSLQLVWRRHANYVVTACLPRELAGSLEEIHLEPGWIEKL